MCKRDLRAQDAPQKPDAHMSQAAPVQPALQLHVLAVVFDADGVQSPFEEQGGSQVALAVSIRNNHLW